MSICVPKILVGACAAIFSFVASAEPASVRPAASVAPPAGAPQPGDDCARAYGGKHVSCKRVPCSEDYRSYIGTWKGEFSSYVREKSRPGEPVFRPYHDTITYAPDACFTNPENGDNFILGHLTDTYPAFGELPAKEETGLLVTGIHGGDQKPFLRTVGRDGMHEFALSYRNRAAGLAIWSLDVPAADHSPEMSYATIDGRDWEAAPLERRNVIVTLTVGSEEHPLWRGVIAHGWHAREP